MVDENCIFYCTRCKHIGAPSCERLFENKSWRWLYIQNCKYWSYEKIVTCFISSIKLHWKFMTMLTSLWPSFFCPSTLWKWLISWKRPIIFRKILLKRSQLPKSFHLSQSLFMMINMHQEIINEVQHMIICVSLSRHRPHKNQSAHGLFHRSAYTLPH